MPMTSTYAQSEIDPVFAAVCQHWIFKIRNAYDHKRQHFQKTAYECMQFFNGPKDWDDLMSGSCDGAMNGRPGHDTTVSSPDFKVVVNKAFEFVTIFGPTLYYENPVRLARPRVPVQVPPQFFPSPQIYQALAQQEDTRLRENGLKGVLMESYLNYLPGEFGLALDSRMAIDEGLLKGRGTIWTELYQPPGSEIRFVRSKFESVDHLFIDPDARSLEDAKWIARRCIQPVWQVERDFGLRRGSLRGNFESMAQQANIMLDENLQFDRKRGYTNDLLVFYKVWSKMGLGGRLSGINQAFRGPLEMFGDYSYICVAENVAFPLNCSPDSYNDPGFQADKTQVFQKFSWPTPFWCAEKWPVSCLDFHVVPESPWPYAHLKAAMGELRFLNWASSWLMGRIRTSCRDFLAVRKSLGEEMKETLLRGEDLALLEIEAENPGAITDLVSFLQHPEVNGDIWKMISAQEQNFDKRTGLNELLYGDAGGTQIRSAEEFAGRNQNASLRPDDMAKVVEAWMAEVAKKEGVCARLHLRGDDTVVVLGTLGAAMWDQYVATPDAFTACRELEYTIEAGSSRRPNKELEARTMTDMYTAVGPFLQTYAQATGDVGPINNLVADMAKSRSLDPGRYTVSAPLPPPQPVAPGGAPGGEPTAPPANGEQI